MRLAGLGDIRRAPRLGRATCRRRAEGLIRLRLGRMWATRVTTSEAQEVDVGCDNSPYS